ncbi:MAG: PAS domain-containing protein [Chloroflexi bacterium]|nr:PAS domain-containing protein [Chloroflexota bacterium]
MNDTSNVRKSGLALLGDIPWGTDLCLLYQSTEDMLEVLMPFFQAGLDNEEFCLWIAGASRSTSEAWEAMRSRIPSFASSEAGGQIALVTREEWEKADQKGRIASFVNRAFLNGFAGLRLGIDSHLGQLSLSTAETEALSRDFVLKMVSYPRDEFDAVRLMDVVKGFRYSLVRNGKEWELIESSEVRVATDALRRNEEKLSSLFAHMEEGFAYQRIIVDSEGRPCDYVYLEVNDAFECQTGLKRENIIGKKVTEVLPGIREEKTDWIGIYGKVALTGKPARFDSFAAGLNRWYSVSAFMPHPGYCAVTFADVTENKKAEAEILSIKTEWERTFDSVPDLIAIIDRDHKVVRANKAMADKLRLTPQQCIGRSCHEIVHGMPAVPGFCPLPSSCTDGQSHSVEIHDPRLGGHFLITTTPLLDQGKAKGVVHVARDISEQKRAAAVLEQRTRELESANRELEAFSYSVSHDLKAPLRIMDGYSQAILEDYTDKLDDQGKAWLNNIRSSSRLMGQLINDILNLSRISRSEMRIEKVSLSNVADRIVQELKQAEPGRTAEFEVCPGIECVGDAGLLRLALQNLLGNAFKYTSRVKDARIRFGTKDISGAPAYFVADNGIGFDMRYAGKLFQPFQRLHSEKDFPGTGIGLATVQRVMKRHSGQVWAEAEEGKGATFYFSLDREKEDHGH